MSSLRYFLRECEEHGYSWEERCNIALKQFPLWRDERAWIVLARLHEFPHAASLEYVWLPQRRRGNNAYREMLQKRFAVAFKAARAKDVSEFGACSLLTLTSSVHELSKQRALEEIDKNWNLLATRIRQQIKRKFDFVRVIELTKNGYAHLHVLLINVPFLSQKWLSGIWEKAHSSPVVDIRAVPAVYGLKYVLKYLFKSFSNDELQSVLWFVRKRQWTVSRSFWELCARVVHLNSALSNSKHSSPLDDNVGAQWVYLGTWEEARDGEPPPWGELVIDDREILTLAHEHSDAESLMLLLRKFILRVDSEETSLSSSMAAYYAR